jgi:serine/threonine protein kinase
MSASGDYKILKRLGSGPGGAVYLAEIGGGKVALRQFESQAAKDSEIWRAERKRFLDAGGRTLTLKHPRIVPVREVIDEAGEAFVAMEYVEGPTLKAVLASRPFDAMESDAVLAQIAQAVDFANSRGVLHGDLKPSSIFTQSNRGIKVSDFSISPIVWRDPDQTLPLSLIHGYLSPEHLTVPRYLSARTDQYSLAAIAYEMFAGQPLYALGVSDLRPAILGGRITPPSQVNQQLPVSLDAPLLKALDPDPSRRFSSCVEFTSALGAILITQPEPRRRLRSTALVGGLVLAGVVAAGSIWVYRTSQSEPPPAANHPPPVSQVPQKKTTSNETTEANHTKATVGLTGKTTTRVAATGTMRHTPTAEPTATRSNTKSPAEVVDRDNSPVEGHRLFQIDVFSRQHRIEPGQSFSTEDTELGELGQGDLQAVVSYFGAQPPKGPATLEWSIDGITHDQRQVKLNQRIEYGNEPTVGTYTLTLKVRKVPVQTFTFRISP